jgi:hypothetical protein
LCRTGPWSTIRGKTCPCCMLACARGAYNHSRLRSIARLPFCALQRAADQGMQMASQQTGGSAGKAEGASGVAIIEGGEPLNAVPMDATPGAQAVVFSVPHQHSLTAAAGAGSGSIGAVAGVQAAVGAFSPVQHAVTISGSGGTAAAGAMMESEDGEDSDSERARQGGTVGGMGGVRAR